MKGPDVVAEMEHISQGDTVAQEEMEDVMMELWMTIAGALDDNYILAFADPSDPEKDFLIIDAGNIIYSDAELQQ